jgi:hypothetical protein
MPIVTRADAATAVSPQSKAPSSETRFTGRVEGPVTVVLDSTGHSGSFSGDVPLDSFSPR